MRGKFAKEKRKALESRDTPMDSLILHLREKREARNAENEQFEKEQELQHQELKAKLSQLKEERIQCTKTIFKNLNTLTGQKHTISKVLQESDQCTGLPISNAHHRQAVDFLVDAMNLINNPDVLIKNSRDSIDVPKLSTDVQLCAQSAADNFQGLKASTDKAETLMNNIHIIADQLNDEDPGLDGTLSERLNNTNY